LRLIERSDIVANNFTSGVMDRLGLGYEAVRAVNPSAIYLSMPMVGDEGPDRASRGYGLMLGAMSGFIGVSGHADGNPVGTGTNYPDHVPNPLHAAIAVMAALRHRDATGEGQHVELSQLESTVNVIGGSILEASVTSRAPRRQGNAQPGAAPHGVYPCAGTDTWCAIGVFTDEQWTALCRTLDAGELLAVDRWRTAEGRCADRDLIDAELVASTQRHEVWALTDRLCTNGVPAAVVEDARDVTLHDAQLRHRGHWVALPHVEMGSSLYDASAARLSRTPGRLTSAAPRLGEHTREVACDVLGLTAEEYEALDREHVFR
jgi:benzylsuccinate CoA-transferase BbsF subunit